MKRFWGIKKFIFYLLPIFLLSCSPEIKYEEIPIPDRRMNLSGLVKVSTEYLNHHPKDFYKFHRILTRADEALGDRTFLTKAGVMKWIRKTAIEEGYDETMPVFLFLRTVYLNGWGNSYLNRVDLSEREYLYDLISAVMGGMHLCSTCSTRMEDEGSREKSFSGFQQ